MSSNCFCIWNVFPRSFMWQPNNLWMLVKFLNVSTIALFSSMPSVEDLCESAVQKPERPFRPAGNPHGLCQPHLRPLDLHPAQKDSGPQADGENQVSVLQNGRKGTKERRAVPLCRRPLLFLHHLQGLTLTGFTWASGNDEHLPDLPVPIWGTHREAGVISSGDAGRLQAIDCTDVTGPPGGRGASDGAFTEWFRGHSAGQANERASIVPKGPCPTCNLHRWGWKHTGEMYMTVSVISKSCHHCNKNASGLKIGTNESKNVIMSNGKAWRLNYHHQSIDI